VARKIALVIVALLIPGGLIALFCAWAGRALSQTERGRKAISYAQKRVPAWMTSWSAPLPDERIAA
jgi:hypothetical protein